MRITGGTRSLERGEATRRPKAAVGDQGGAPTAQVPGQEDGIKPWLRSQDLGHFAKFINY